MVIHQHHLMLTGRRAHTVLIKELSGQKILNVDRRGVKMSDEETCVAPAGQLLIRLRLQERIYRHVCV